MIVKIEKACEILGVEPGDTLEDVKRKYRTLIARIHPDAESYCGKNMDYGASRSSAVDHPKGWKQLEVSEVTASYHLLVKQGGFEEYQVTLGNDNSSERRQKAKWDAPEHPGAYAAREILQYAEDQEGNPIGTYVAAVGKYCWNPEAEDFELFLKSILGIVNGILEQKEERLGYCLEEAIKFQVQKELLYLLVGQYTDVESGLEAFSKEIKTDKNGNAVYYIPGMLELQCVLKKGELSPGVVLRPLKLKDHRLYIGKQDGQALGYLSFSDDRLYYVLIPMFENREVQVKITVDQMEMPQRSGLRYVKLHLWVRRVRGQFQVQESVNCKIDQLLHRL